MDTSTEQRVKTSFNADNLPKGGVLKDILVNVEDNVDKVKMKILPLCTSELYSKLSTEDKVKHDLLLSSAITSLYWVYVSSLGKDPAQHTVMREIERIKKYTDRAKEIKDRQSMPRLDKQATKRFVRSGLWNLEDKNRKRKRNQVDDD
jgi:exosome complex protein LRP1